MGKASKVKGRTAEYKVRDDLIGQGFPDAKRVFMSGAFAHDKGDVKFTRDGKEYRIEVKVRKGDSFKHIYSMLASSSTPGHLSVAIPTPDELVCVDITTDIKNFFDNPVYFYSYINFPPGEKKVVSVRKWIQECDFLALKNDRKEIVYLRFR